MVGVGIVAWGQRPDRPREHHNAEPPPRVNEARVLETHAHAPKQCEQEGGKEEGGEEGKHSAAYRDERTFSP